MNNDSNIIYRVILFKLVVYIFKLLGIKKKLILNNLFI